MNRNHLLFTGPNSKQNLIEFSRKFRNQLLIAIERGDTALATEYGKEMFKFAQNEELSLFRKTSISRIRFYKNFLFSYNTTYSIAAEKGGLSPLKSLYIAEKYSILIESAETVRELEGLHITMIQEYVDMNSRSNKVKKKNLAQKVADYIQYNFSKDNTLDHLTKVFQVHSSHLTRSFKKEYGVTMGQFQRKIRISEAKKLLEETNLSFIEVAFMVGYDDPYYFNRVFKKEVSMTPKQYIKLSRKQ